MSATTLMDIAEFILHNRRGKAFQHWTLAEILTSLRQGIEDCCICVTKSKENKISGVVLATKDTTHKELHIQNILTDGTKGAVSMMVFKAKELYPEYKISGRRHGKFRDFSSDLINKFQQKV